MSVDMDVWVGWIGLGGVGLDWIGLGWIGLDWIGLDWIGFVSSLWKRIWVGSAGGVSTVHGREFEFGISTVSTQATTTNQWMLHIHRTIHTLKPSVRSVRPESVLPD